MVYYNPHHKLGSMSSPTNPLNNQGPFFHCSNDPPLVETTFDSSNFWKAHPTEAKPIAKPVDRVTWVFSWVFKNRMERVSKGDF